MIHRRIWRSLKVRLRSTIWIRICLGRGSSKNIFFLQFKTLKSRICLVVTADREGATSPYSTLPIRTQFSTYKYVLNSTILYSGARQFFFFFSPLLVHIFVLNRYVSIIFLFFNWWGTIFDLPGRTVSLLDYTLAQWYSAGFTPRSNIIHMYFPCTHRGFRLSLVQPTPSATVHVNLLPWTCYCRSFAIFVTSLLPWRWTSFD